MTTLTINKEVKGEVTNAQLNGHKADKKIAVLQKKAIKRSTKKAVKKTKTVKKAKRMTEEVLSKKYAHYVKGTLGFNAADERATCKISCSHKGCKKLREVNTSDLFQVKRCVEHTKLFRNEARKKNKK